MATTRRAPARTSTPAKASALNSTPMNAKSRGEKKPKVIPERTLVSLPRRPSPIASFSSSPAKKVPMMKCRPTHSASSETPIENVSIIPNADSLVLSLGLRRASCLRNCESQYRDDHSPPSCFDDVLSVKVKRRQEHYEEEGGVRD